jgi:hypothetical protein
VVVRVGETVTDSRSVTVVGRPATKVSTAYYMSRHTRPSMNQRFAGVHEHVYNGFLGRGNLTG